MMTVSDRTLLGKRGESLAEQWLVRKGYRIVERNYRCPIGEVDRVLRLGDMLVFVEVKTRRGTTFGLPAEAVTPAKQRRISHAALQFLGDRGEVDIPCRFDIVEVLLVDGAPPRIRHSPSAFEFVE